MEWIVGSRIRYGRPPPLAFRRETSSPFGRRHVFTSFTPPPYWFTLIFSQNYLLEYPISTQKTAAKFCCIVATSPSLRFLSAFPHPSPNPVRDKVLPPVRQCYTVSDSRRSRRRAHFPHFIHSSRDFLMLSRSALGIALASAAGVFWGVHEHCRVIPHGVGRI